MFDHLRVDEEKQNERLQICAKCEHNRLNVCKKCGCILRLKTQWKSTKCPVGKWDKVP
jgi:hypothetical protein